MQDKLDIYGIFGLLIPGTLVIAGSAVLFPQIDQKIGSASFPDGFMVIALVALAIFLGNLIQGLASFIEPALNLIWRGRPSETALSKGFGKRYLSKDTTDRIKAKLTLKVAGDPTDQSLFQYAVSAAKSVKESDILVFNSLYAYHRAMIVLVLLLTILFIVSSYSGVVTNWILSTKLIAWSSVIFILWLLVYRTNQRAIYYVREVLLCAERVIDSAKVKPGADADTERGGSS